MNKMTFGDAIAALKEGKKVARRGWRCKEKFLWLKPECEVKSEWCRDPKLKEIADRHGGSIVGIGVICLYTPDSICRPAVLNGWTPLQCDMLSEDWAVVE